MLKIKRFFDLITTEKVSSQIVLAGVILQIIIALFRMVVKGEGTQLDIVEIYVLLACGQIFKNVIDKA